MSDADGSPFRPPGSDANPYGPPDHNAPPEYGGPPSGYRQAPSPGYPQAPPPPGPPQYGNGYSYGTGYGGYGSGYGYAPGYGSAGYAARPRTETMAVLSLVFSLVSWPLCATYGVGIIASVAGLVLGLIARRRIKASEGMLAGDGLAIGGVIVSIVNIVLFVAAIAFVIVALSSASID